MIARSRTPPALRGVLAAGRSRTVRQTDDFRGDVVVIRSPSPRFDRSPLGRGRFKDNDFRPDHWDDRGRFSFKGFFDGKGKGKGKGKDFGRPDFRWSDQGKGGKGGFRNGDFQVSTNRVHVSNLPNDITQGALERLFGQHGHVLGLQLLGGRMGAGHMCAIIRYATNDDAEAAIAALHNKHELNPGAGPIVVKLAKPNPRWDT